MTRQTFFPPQYGQPAFNCPKCQVYATQSWSSRSYGITFALCSNCHEPSIWVKNELIFPTPTQAPPPNDDLPEDIQNDYMEAAAIMGSSPRGAAALLRLCIQKLCKHLGESGENLNNDIASLVKKGLNPTIQKCLDTVRVIGNEAVHPGVLDLTDKADTVVSLFFLVNMVADAMITQPKTIGSLYESLPANKRDQIEQRDKNTV